MRRRGDALRSIRFGIVAIAICGLTAGAAAIQVGTWGGEVRLLAERQEAISGNIVQLRNAMRAMLDLETGQRGYLLTGQDAYLEAYENGRRDLMPALNRLLAAYRDDPETVLKLAKLVALGRAKEEELARSINLRRDGDLTAALELVRTGEGKQIMDAFDREETALLDQFRTDRTALVFAATQRFRQTMLLCAFVVVLNLSLLAVAVAWLSGSIRQIQELRIKREREAMHDALTGLPNRRYRTNG